MPAPRGSSFNCLPMGVLPAVKNGEFLKTSLNPDDVEVLAILRGITSR